MKKFLKSFVLIFLLASTYVTAEPVMTLITVNTDDPAGYLEWARGSSETIGKTNNASAVGICSPRIGAEEMGDLYFWNLLIQTRRPGKTTLTTQLSPKK